MIDYFNQVFDVMKLYIQYIFSLQFVNGVSIGSVLFVALLFWCISVAFWSRSTKF